jgi:YD repeat-containing protein
VPLGTICPIAILPIKPVIGAFSSGAASYDAGGNLTSEPGKTYQYDAENRLVSINNGCPSTLCYTYNAEGRRVVKTTGGMSTYYYYDISGKVIAEKSQSNVWTTGYVYLNGQMVAQYSDGTTYFAHKDHLGSMRVLTKIDKTVQENMDYLPFGEQVSGGSSTRRKFTGKERDTESGLGGNEAGSTTTIDVETTWESPMPVALRILAYASSGGNPQVVALAWQAYNQVYASNQATTNPARPSQQAVSTTSDKRTDVMLSANTIPPTQSVTAGAQFEMVYMIVPQADTMKELQDKYREVQNNPTIQASYSKMEIKLWESQRGGKWQWQGDPLKGKARDVLNVFAVRVDQRWYIDGKRVQMVIGKDSAGRLIKAWTVHVEITLSGPRLSKVD